jgi:hypothetical protein
LQCPGAGAITAPVAAIAQPVEHIIRNDGVGGSNPSCGTIIGSNINKLKEDSVCLALGRIFREAWGKQWALRGYTFAGWVNERAAH